MNEILSHKLAVAVMVMNRDHKFLLVKSYKRGWEFPGGFVGIGESIKEAAIREVKEESGIDIQLTNFLGIEQDVAKSTCVVIFKGTPVSGKFAASDENQDVGYFTFDEAMSMITLGKFRDRIVRCLKEKEIPFFIEK
ncbi:NUDIX hydrolase [Bacillus songklensis]|uniref:NUDIX hydrolase n=1 Tax=Bacillus songklensis TaxID=1069116 RepID=A0ABV8B7Q5_9BACI